MTTSGSGPCEIRKRLSASVIGKQILTIFETRRDGQDMFWHRRVVLWGFACFIFVLSLCSSSFAVSDQIEKTGSQQRDDYALILMNNKDTLTANKARDFVVSQGGRIVILAPPHVMIGWIPFELRKGLIGKYGIEQVVQGPIDLENLRYTDEPAQNAVRYFNDAVTSFAAMGSSGAQNR